MSPRPLDGLQDRMARSLEQSVRFSAASAAILLVGLACGDRSGANSSALGGASGGGRVGSGGMVGVAGAPVAGTGTAGGGGTLPADGGSGGAATAGNDPGVFGGAGASGASGASGSAGMGGSDGKLWVGTWSAAPQLTEAANVPPAPGLSGKTLRQIFYVSIGGSRLRIHLSNEYGQSPVTLNSVHLAVASNGSAVEVSTDRALAFAGAPSITIPAGGSVTSEPLDFALTPQSRVALSIAFGSTPNEITGHPGSRTTSYIADGDVAGAASFTAPAMTDHWYYLSGLDVVAEPGGAAVVTFGDSITDGRGSTTNGNDRWPDNLSRRLRQNATTQRVAVLNQAIGGNAVLSSAGNGPPGVTRFERDVLDQAGVRWVIVLHGVNDIGLSTSPSVAEDLIEAYGQLVSAARLRGLRVYGVPILPFGGSSYDTPEHEAARQTVNAWIRTPGHFDEVIDLEAAVRDPADTTRLLPAYDTGDSLHLNAAGYQKMADAIDVALFAG